MSDWEIRFADEPDLNRWLNELSDAALEKVTILLGLLRRCGNQLRLPHSKALGERLNWRDRELANYWRVKNENKKL